MFCKLLNNHHFCTKTNLMAEFAVGTVRVLLRKMARQFQNFPVFAKFLGDCWDFAIKAFVFKHLESSAFGKKFLVPVSVSDAGILFVVAFVPKPSLA